MDPKDLIGKPIIARCWNIYKGYYYVPSGLTECGTSFRGTAYKINTTDIKEVGIPFSCNRDWVLAYDILASIEVDRLLED
jgi:hypothetical protein